MKIGVDTDRGQEQRESVDLMSVNGLVYGVTLRGDLPPAFQSYLSAPTEHRESPWGSIEVRYESVTQIPEVDEIWASEPIDAHDDRRFALFRCGSSFGLTVQCDGRGLFRIRPDSIEIEWLPGGTGAAHYFFSYALPLWLESRGIPVLHASAVSFGEWAVAFVGPSGMGKSTLCAGLIRGGCDFVADDELALHRSECGDWLCHHGPPFSRLWPSSLEQRLGIPAQELPRVYQSREKRMISPADNSSESRAPGVPLRAVYLLDRRPDDAGDIRISPFTARQSLIHLIEHSLVRAPIAALGWSASSLERLASVVAIARVRKLSYPEGGEPWECIRELIEEDSKT